MSKQMIFMSTALAVSVIGNVAQELPTVQAIEQEKSEPAFQFLTEEQCGAAQTFVRNILCSDITAKTGITAAGCQKLLAEKARINFTPGAENCGSMNGSFNMRRDVVFVEPE